MTCSAGRPVPRASGGDPVRAGPRGGSPAVGLRPRRTRGPARRWFGRPFAIDDQELLEDRVDAHPRPTWAFSYGKTTSWIRARAASRFESAFRECLAGGRQNTGAIALGVGPQPGLLCLAYTIPLSGGFSTCLADGRRRTPRPGLAAHRHRECAAPSRVATRAGTAPRAGAGRRERRHQAGRPLPHPSHADDCSDPGISNPPAMQLRPPSRSISGRQPAPASRRRRT